MNLRADMVGKDGEVLARLQDHHQIAVRYAGPDGEGLLYDKPLSAKLISVVVAFAIGPRVTFCMHSSSHNRPPTRPDSD